MSLQIGTIYEVRTNESDFLTNERVEFIGGADDDLFTNGCVYDWLGESEVVRSPDQTPLEFTEDMQKVKSKGLAGEDL